MLRELLAGLGLLFRSTPIVFGMFLQLLAMFWTRLPLASVAASDGFDARDRLIHLILPVLTLTVPFGAWSSVIFDDFFRARRVSGTASASILVPIARTLASIGPALLAASLLVEPLYAWPGIARLFYFSLSKADFGTVAGVLFSYTVAAALLVLCGRLVPAAQRDASRPRPDLPAARHSIRTSVAGALALAVLLVAVAGGIAANLIAPVGPYRIDLEHWQGYPLAPGVAGHPLGTDENGRDLLARLLVGVRTSLGIALGGALIATAIGAAVAKATPWIRDRGALAVAGIRPFAALPFILFTIAVLVAWWHRIAVLNPLTIALIIGVFAWPTIVPAFRPRTAGSFGAIAGVTGCALLLEVTLSIHGFGVQPPIPSLGNMLVNAQSTILIAPWAATVPAGTIIALLCALYALADDLRERDASA